MNPNLIPALDSAGLPGPPWLFHVLLVFTFFLHLVFMNLTLGGTLLAVVAHGPAPGAVTFVVEARLELAQLAAMAVVPTRAFGVPGDAHEGIWVAGIRPARQGHGLAVVEQLHVSRGQRPAEPP